MVNINLNVRGLLPSATLRINEQSNQLIREGKKVWKLGLGQSPFPIPERVVQSLQEHAHEKDYLPVKGLPGLRRTVCDHYEQLHGVVFDPENVLVGPGSKELIFLLQLVYYGDLLIPTPSWVSYAPQARIIGRNVHWIPTRKEHNWLITPDELDRICSRDPSCPRLLILNYPNNPTGYTYTDEELSALAGVARKYQIIIVADEIYGLLQHNEGPYTSIATYYPEGTIISGGLSKWCAAGGWRLGIFAFPEALAKLADMMSVAASETFTATAAPIQYAAITAYEPHEEIQAYLNKVRRILSVLGNTCNDLLNKTGIGNLPPHGAFYLFPDFSDYADKLLERDIRTSEQLASALLNQTGVATLPGSNFGCWPDIFTLRLAYVNFNGREALEEAAHTDTISRSFIEQHCSPPLEAMKQIRDWFQSL